MNIKPAFCAMLLAALLPSTPMAKPLPSGRPTAVELKALPDYCQARFGNDEALRKAHAKRLGTKHFLHIHHHCIGLNLINRSRVTFEKNLRRAYLQSAVAQFNYVLARWPADFALTAEARSQKGVAELMLKSVPASRR